MRKKRFDPSYLEPKDGDFAGFVEKLNQKNVAELKALQVNDELMREQVNEELNGAASGVWNAPIPDVKASDIKASSPMHRDTVISQPEDAFKVQVPSGATNRPAPKRSASSREDIPPAALIFTPLPTCSANSRISSNAAPAPPNPVEVLI